MSEDLLSKRKKDHIDLAFHSRTEGDELDGRFYYEPVLASHPKEEPISFAFLGKKMKWPIWVSSMTGGTGEAGYINRNLARVCAEYGLGMGLGSCRPLLESDQFFEDFNLRPIIGEEHPFYANLGVAQVDKLLSEGREDRILDLVDRLQADGLIIHVNPLQEWLQPEGDRFVRPPLETISELLEKTNLNLVVKEVGQGMGPESLKALLRLPLQAIEFAAFGGTNFAKLELLRSEPAKRDFLGPVSRVGHTAAEMTDMVNLLMDETDVRCHGIIVSGGITNFMDGHFLIRKMKLPAIYGQASAFLKYAKVSYEALNEFIAHQVKGLQLAQAYLKLR